MRRAVAALAALVLLAAACSDDDASSTPDPPPLPPAEEEAIAEAAADGCDPLDPRHCLLPFPSDHFTVADEGADTGRRVALPAAAMPVSADGVGVDPAEWNRNDGFSPGTPILAHLPGVDPMRSGAAPEGDVARSLADDSPVVLVDADTGERHPHWVELDENASSEDTALLVIRPAVNLPEGHTIAVGLRGMVDEDDAPLPSSAAFRAARDGLDDQLAARLEPTFAALEDVGVERGELQLAWSFTVASERNLSERLLHLRDEAFAALGDEAPTHEITSVTDDPDPEIARRVEGTFEVPSFLTGDGGPGERFRYAGDVGSGPDRLPVAGGTLTAAFTCIVPRSLVGPSADGHGRLAVYGHGLLGSRGEVEAGNVRAMADEHGFVFCATD